MSPKWVSGGEELWVGDTPKKRGTDKRVNKSKPRQIYGAHIVDCIHDEGKRHCYLIDKRPTNKELQKWSSHVTGDVWVFDNYFVHNAGPTSETYILTSAWPTFSVSMHATQQLTGKDVVGFTPSQHGREIVDWLHILNRATEDHRHHILPYYEFIACTPTTLPYAYYYDMSSAYWKMIEKAPSPRILYNPRVPKGLGWKPLNEVEYHKWNTMLEAMRPDQCKSTRLAIVGNWVGGYNPEKKRYNRFHKGNIVAYSARRIHPLSTFGCYIVRLVYEICQEEYLIDNGHYARIDCVITTNPDGPTYWKQLGIDWKLKREGPLNLITSQVYQIGAYSTQYYKYIYEYRIPAPGAKPHPRLGIKPHTSLPHLIPREDYIHPSMLKHWKGPDTRREEPWKPPTQLRLQLHTPHPNKPPVTPADHL